MEKFKRISVYLGVLVLIIIDQVVKLGVINGMKDKSITIIKGILSFTYCENKGVAFSFGYGHVPLFIIINVLLIGGLIVYYEKNKSEFKCIISKIFFTMVIAGGTSNLLDRVIRGFVVDFIDVGELFMVGKSSASTLKKIGINTIGELAVCKESYLKKHFKNQAAFLIRSANGIDESIVEKRSDKSDSISVSETLPYDVDDIEKIKEILFRQTEEVTRTLRWQKQYAKTVAITYKNNLFQSYQHQVKLPVAENSTTNIYKAVIDILYASWREESIRNIGVRLSDFCDNRSEQVNIFSEPQEVKVDKMQEIVDDINKKYGGTSVMPAAIKKIGSKRNKRDEKREG